MSDTDEPLWRSDLVWAAVIGAAVAYEVHAMKTDKLDRTFTRTTRRYFRTRHPYGRAVFALGWGYLATWFMRHILETATADGNCSHSTDHAPPWSMLPRGGEGQ